MAVGRRGDAHIGRLQRDQHRVEVLRSPVPAILHDRQDLVDQQLLAADLDIGVLAQRGQHVGAIAAGGQLVQLRLRERHLQDAGPQGRRGQRRRQGEADRQVGVGRVGGAGQAIGRAEQHALAAGGVAERGHRHRRGKQAGRRIVDRELEAVVQAVVRHRDQLAQDFLARVAVQAVVVRQAHQAPAVHRRLQQGLVVAGALESHGQVAPIAFELGAQEGPGAAQRDAGHLQCPHARPIAFVPRDLRVQIRQDPGRDRGIGLLGRGAGIGLLAVQQRTAVERDADAAQLRVHRGLRIDPVHRLDQHQVGVGHVLRDVNALVGAGHAAGQSGLGREALARMDGQHLGGRADGAIAGVQLDAIAQHHGVVAGRGVRVDAVESLDIDGPGRRGHLLQHGPGAGAALGEIGQPDIVARLGRV